jgi:hypothetical protein
MMLLMHVPLQQPPHLLLHLRYTSDAADACTTAAVPSPAADGRRCGRAIGLPYRQQPSTALD